MIRVGFDSTNESIRVAPMFESMQSVQDELKRLNGVKAEHEELSATVAKASSIEEIQNACKGILGNRIIQIAIGKKDLNATKEYIQDQIDSNLGVGMEIIKSLEKKVKDFDPVVKTVLSALKSAGYKTKRSGDNIVVYPKGDEDTYNLMHDVKDVLFEDAKVKSDMDMFLPSRGSAWTALSVTLRSIRFKINSRSSKSKDAVEIDFTDM